PAARLGGRAQQRRRLPRGRRQRHLIRSVTDHAQPGRPPRPAHRSLRRHRLPRHDPRAADRGPRGGARLPGTGARGLRARHQCRRRERPPDAPQSQERRQWGSPHREETTVMDTLPLTGIKVIDFTGVQAGPACTQLLAWFGADVLKVERTTGGDVTRRQLRDIPDVDALYFTQLNSNKKSLAVDTKTPEGKKIMEQLIRK